jgi:hypothetical protein
LKLSLWLALLAMQTSAWATTVVVIWTPAGAIFRADAKLTASDGKDAGTTCKIRQISNDILFAEACIFEVRSVDIDTRSIIHEALISTGTLDQRIDKIETGIVPILTGILNAPLVKPDILESLTKGQPVQGL